ncbi:MAG: single-stranded DNA-binding protein [Actinomycetota bacterium]|nr:single-stranded DNA-binding protein [Actinomycetota bacterium]
MLNSVNLIGNLTRDPELRYTQSGAPVANFTIALNRIWMDSDGEKHEDAIFVPIICWRKQAETVSQYLRKGSRVVVEGRLTQRRWETESGEKRSILEVTAIRVGFLSRRQEDEVTQKEQPQKPTQEMKIQEEPTKKPVPETPKAEKAKIVKVEKAQEEIPFDDLPDEPPF